MKKQISWDLEYDDPKYSGRYTVRKWTWEEKLEANEAAMTIIDPKKGADGVKISIVKLQQQKLKFCIVEAPFKTDTETLTNVPSDIIEDLITTIDSLNGVEKNLKKTFID